MTLLRIHVTALDTDKAAALLRRLEDVATSPHTRGVVEGKTIVADIDERDIPAVKRVLSYYNSWIAISYERVDG